MTFTVDRELVDRTAMVNKVPFSSKFKPYSLAFYIGEGDIIYRAMDACKEIGLLCSEPRDFDESLGLTIFGAFEGDSGMLVRGTRILPGPVFLSVVGNLSLSKGADLIYDILRQGAILPEKLEESDGDPVQQLNPGGLLWEGTVRRLANSAERNYVDPALLLRASNFQDFLNLNGIDRQKAFAIVRQKYDVPSMALEQLV
jgi:hypothetical protein